MRKLVHFCICLALVSTFSFSCAFGLNLEPRILAKVGDEAISTFDVKKKLDVIFLQQCPELAHENEARLEFYSRYWQDALRDLVQGKLILMHAEEKEKKVSQKLVSEGDIHREMQQRFGPGVIENLSKIGLSYEEGSKMIHDELKVQTMLWISVHSNAIHKVKPEDIREKYIQFVKEMPNKLKWRYQVITLNAPNAPALKELIELTQSSVKEEGLDALETLNTKVSAARIEKAPLSTPDTENSASNSKNTLENTSLKVSNFLETGEDEITSERKKLLETLKAGEVSGPIEETLRSSGKKVTRLLALHEKVETPVPSFKEKQEELKNVTLNEIYQSDMQAYIKELEGRFGVEICFPKDFQPFSR